MLRISLREINIFRRKKGHRSIVILKLSYTFPNPNKDKKNNRTPTGYATHLPSGDRTFSLEKGHRSVILKVQYTVSETTNVQVKDPYRICYANSLGLYGSTP